MEAVLKILIIDKNPDFLLRSGELLKKSGFELSIASNEAEVLELLEMNPPDIILLGIQNNGIDAPGLCSLIKSKPHIDKAIIVLMSEENVAFKEIEKGINAGADDFITKPVSDIMLLARINTLAKIKKATIAQGITTEYIEQRNIFLRDSTVLLNRIAKSSNLYKNNFIDFLHEITENTADQLNVERVSIWFFNESKSMIICSDLFTKSSQQHFQGDEILATEFPVYFEAIKNARIVVAADAANNEATYEFTNNYLQRTGIVSMLDSPIRLKGEVSGVICVESVGEMRDWNPDEINFSASISDFISLAREIHQCKVHEIKARESDSLKSAFIANLSHKLRTPLNSISGFVNLLSDKELSDEDFEHFINIINLNIQRLLHLVADVIDISKIQTGQIQIQKTKVHLNSLFAEIKQSADEFLDLYHKENLQLILNLPEENFQMETDPDRLKQVFGYLIDNAVKFTNHGSVEIGYKPDPDNTVILFVKDTGIGIPPDKSGTVFIPFNQFDQYYIRKYEGTGLGLAISNGIVALMQGTIWIESEHGVGTTFWIKLPLIQNTEEQESVNIYPDHGDEEINWSGKKILIVEDVINNYELLETMLHRTGATIIWADTGEIALQFFNSNPDLDLVLMDIKLPDIDGLELTRQMKAIRPDMPIVAQTAFALTGDREKVLESGCDEYLPKPISRIKLLRVLSEFIR